MSAVQEIEAVHVEAAPVPAVDKLAAAALRLEGDELIQLSIKPSLWFIPIVSFRFVLAMVLLTIALALVSRGGALPAGSASFGIPAALLAAQVPIALAVLRVGLAALQWASRLYVLTNRRVMRFRGVLTVEVAECPLVRIGGAELRVAWYEASLRLGSIHMTPLTADAPALTWDHLARPDEIYQLLNRAIRKSQSAAP